MSHIKPTVGRKIYFQPSDDQHSPTGGLIAQHSQNLAVQDRQPLDATINYVHSDTMIDITFNDHRGNRHFLTSVPLVPVDGIFLIDGSGEVMGGGYAYWMPYQAGQAKVSGEVGSGPSAAPAPGPAPATPFTSRFGLGDKVRFSDYDHSGTAKVTSVTFTDGSKVLYGVRFGDASGGPELGNIDSCDVRPAS